MELVKAFSYRVKESSDGTIYFRAAPEKLTEKASEFLALVALLKPEDVA